MYIKVHKNIFKKFADHPLKMILSPSRLTHLPLVLTLNASTKMYGLTEDWNQMPDQESGKRHSADVKCIF